MRVALLLAILGAYAVAPSLPAASHSLPKEKPLASITLPDDWKAEVYNEGEGVEAVSPDKQVYLAIETTDADNVEDATKEAAEYLANKGVMFDDESIKKSEQKINGMDATRISWEGEDDNGPAKISLAIVAVTPEHGLLLVYWASPEGEKKNQEALNAIIQSIKKAGG